MKRFALTLLVSLTTYLSSFAIGFFSFAEAQEQAYYLTDKMAYELDLTPSQYDLVYQVNLEYFMNVDRAGLQGPLWQYRNTDLSYILFDWQYSIYRSARYFYHPIEFRHSTWYLPLWDRYTRNYYFYTRPTCWHSWRGGLWVNRVHTTPSPFIGHRPHVHQGGMRGDRPNNGYNPGHNHGNNNGYRPNNNRPGNNNGYRPDNNRPNNNRPGNNNGYRPDNNRPGNNGGNATRPDNNRPGNNGGNATRPDNNRSGNNGGYNSGAGNRPSRGGASSSSAPSRGGAPATGGNGTRSFGGGGR